MRVLEWIMKMRVVNVVIFPVEERGAGEMLRNVTADRLDFVDS
jgi:hypothetical protein